MHGEILKMYMETHKVKIVVSTEILPAWTGRDRERAQ